MKNLKITNLMEAKEARSKYFEDCVIFEIFAKRLLEALVSKMKFPRNISLNNVLLHLEHENTQNKDLNLPIKEMQKYKNIRNIIVHAKPKDKIKSGYINILKSLELFNSGLLDIINKYEQK